MMDYPFSDRMLARRLERTEGGANAAFVEARVMLQPSNDATWIEVGGTYAMFDGVDSPLTQTFGLGIFDDAVESSLDAIEAFFFERGASACHEVSPMASATLPALLAERGYRPVELSSVLYRPVRTELRLDRPVNERIRVRRIDLAEADLWADVAAEGWSSESAETAAFVHGFASIGVRSPGTRSFLAELDDQAIAAASLYVGDGVALLAGASTIPRGRNQGAQLALLEARMRFAAEEGCELAMMAAAPGSGSQRNAERQGFRIAYTRTKWQLRYGGA